MAGIYIHIPFCASRCGYCDFYSTTHTDRIQDYLSALSREMEACLDYLGDSAVKTLYFGGGTPSLLSAEQVNTIFHKVSSIWQTDKLEEVTLEANPDDLSSDYIQSLRSTPLNRLSIGIQSFEDDALRLMGRRHSARQAAYAVKSAQDAGFGNITIDLIYGIPGMSMAQWKSNIRSAISLNVQHISAYHLSIEQGTAFHKMARKGDLCPVADSQSAEQYSLLQKMLSEAGFEQYEVSNFAKPGFRAKHNSAYWNGEPYLGLGPSAHSFDRVSRRWNTATLENYITSGFSEKDYEHELLSRRDAYNELLMTSLRKTEGLLLSDLESRFGRSWAERFLASVPEFLSSGMIVCENGRYFIPAEKFLLSDAVIRDLFEV